MFVREERPLGGPPSVREILQGSVVWTPWRSARLLVFALLFAAVAVAEWTAGRASVLVSVGFLIGAGMYFAAWVRLLRH